MTDGDVSNDQALLILGDWQVLLHADTNSAKALLTHFINHCQAFISRRSVSSSLMFGHLFISDPSSLEESEILVWWPVCDYFYWMKYWETIKIAYRQFYKPVGLERARARGKPNPFALFWSDSNDSDNFPPLYNHQINHRLISLIINEPDKSSYIKIFESTFILASQFHIDHGGICLHSAAVARGKDGFLFLGKSEAGKSTVSRLSVEIGYPALGDDLNFIIRDEDNQYRLAASPSPIISSVGYSDLRPPLRGIFTLVQDKQDALVPVQSMKIAQVLFKEFLQETPYVRRMSDKYIKLGFQVCCNIARSVPGYELHFRKKPDFWKLINEEFPE